MNSTDNQPKLTSDQLDALKAIDARNAELRARNEQRLADMKAWLGTKYVLHPANSPKRQEYRTVL
jgi:hypothetical protein